MSKAKLDPQAVKLHSLGNKLVQEQKYNEAITHFEKCLAIEPEYGAAYMHLAEAYEAKKMDDKAFDNYVIAIKLNESIAIQPIESGLYTLLSGPLGKAVMEYKKKLDAGGEVAEPNVIAPVKEGSLVDMAIRPAVEKPRGQKDLKPLKVLVDPADEHISSVVWSVDHVTATVLGDKDIPVVEAFVTFEIDAYEGMEDSFIAVLEAKANGETGPRKLKLKTDADGKARVFFRRSKKSGLQSLTITVDGLEPAKFQDYTVAGNVYSVDISPQEQYYRTAQDVNFDVVAYDFYWNPVVGTAIAMTLQVERGDSGEWDVLDNGNAKTDDTGLATLPFTMPTRGHLKCRMLVENKVAGFSEAVYFNVAPGSATSVIFIPGGGEIKAGTPFALKMRMLDEYDNSIDGIPANIILAESTGGAWTMSEQSSPTTGADGSVTVTVTPPETSGATAVFSVDSEHVENPASFRVSFETISSSKAAAKKDSSPFGDEFANEFDDFDKQATANETPAIPAENPLGAGGYEDAFASEPQFDETIAVASEPDPEPEPTLEAGELSGLPDIDDDAPSYGHHAAPEEEVDFASDISGGGNSSLEFLDVDGGESFEDGAAAVIDNSPAMPGDAFEVSSDGRFGDIPGLDDAPAADFSAPAATGDFSNDAFLQSDDSAAVDRFGDIHEADTAAFATRSYEDEEMPPIELSSEPDDDFLVVDRGAPEYIEEDSDSYKYKEEPVEEEPVEYKKEPVYIEEETYTEPEELSGISEDAYSPETIYTEPASAGGSIKLSLQSKEATCNPGEIIPLKIRALYSDGSPVTVDEMAHLEISGEGSGEDSQFCSSSGTPFGRTVDVEPDISGEIDMHIKTGGRCGAFNVSISMGSALEIFTVNIAPGEPESIALEIDDETPAPGGFTTITARALDSAGNPVPGEFVAVSVAEKVGDPGVFHSETSGVTNEAGEFKVEWSAPSKAGAKISFTASNPSVAPFAVTQAHATVTGSARAAVAPPVDLYDEPAAETDSYQEYSDADAYGDISGEDAFAPAPPAYEQDAFVSQPAFEEPALASEYEQPSDEADYSGDTEYGDEYTQEEQYYEQPVPAPPPPPAPPAFTPTTGQNTSRGASMNQDYNYQDAQESDEAYGAADQLPPPPGDYDEYDSAPPPFMDEGGQDEAGYFMEDDDADPYASPKFVITTGRKANPAVGKFARKVTVMAIIAVLLVPVGYYSYKAFMYMQYQYMISMAKKATLRDVGNTNVEARMYYEKAHKIEPKQIHPMSKLAQIHIMSMEKAKKQNRINIVENEGKQAEAYLKNILTIEPGNNEAIYDLGKVYELNEDFCKAQDQYIKALSNDKGLEAAEAKKSEMRAKCNMQHKMGGGY